MIDDASPIKEEEAEETLEVQPSSQPIEELPRSTEDQATISITPEKEVLPTASTAKPVRRRRIKSLSMKKLKMAMKSTKNSDTVPGSEELKATSESIEPTKKAIAQEDSKKKQMTTSKSTGSIASADKSARSRKSVRAMEKKRGKAKLEESMKELKEKQALASAKRE